MAELLINGTGCLNHVVKGFGQLLSLSMRRPLRVAGWILMAAAVYGINRYFSNLPSPIMVKRADIPEPRNVADLRGILKVTATEPCDFPAVASSGSAVLTGPDGDFVMQASPQWKALPVARERGLFPDNPRVTYGDAAGNWITIARVATGATGRTYHVDSAFNPLPSESCEMISGTSGTIWSFSYDASSGFGGIGEAVTNQGGRYTFNVTTSSATGRDSLAALISAAVLAQ